MRRWASPACSMGSVWPISGCSLPCAIQGCMACRLRVVSSWSWDSTLSHRPWALRLLAIMAPVSNCWRCPAAAQALGGMLAAEHLEDCIHTFAVGQFQHALFVVNFAIVDSMIKPELLHTLQLFVGRRRAIGFDGQQLSDLDRSRAHSAGDGVNQRTLWLAIILAMDRLHGIGSQARFPVGQVSGKKVHRKGG